MAVYARSIIRGEATYLMIDVAYGVCSGNVAALRDTYDKPYRKQMRGIEEDTALGFSRNGATPIKHKPSVGRNVPAKSLFGPPTWISGRHIRLKDGT